MYPCFRKFASLGVKLSLKDSMAGGFSRNFSKFQTSYLEVPANGCFKWVMDCGRVYWHAPVIQLLWRPNSIPFGGNSPSIGGWSVWANIIQHKCRSLAKYWDLTMNRDSKSDWISYRKLRIFCCYYFKLWSNHFSPVVYFYTPWLEKIYLISGSNDLTIFVTETVVGFISKIKTHNSVVPILDFIESFFLVG